MCAITSALSAQGTVVMYNLDPDATNESLLWLFSKYGEVCKIQEDPDRRSQKIITFYDIRHAQVATQVSTHCRLLIQSHTGCLHASRHRSVLEGWRCF